MRRTLLLVAAAVLPALAVAGVAAGIVLTRSVAGAPPSSLDALEERVAAEREWDELVEAGTPSFAPAPAAPEGEAAPSQEDEAPLEAPVEPSPTARENPPSGGAPSEPVDAGPVPEEEPAATCAFGEEKRLSEGRVAYVAAVKRRAVAYDEPSGNRIEAFERLNVNGVPTVFAVVGAVVDQGCEPLWYRVQLPIRPNGTEGWVRAGAVDLFAIRTRIEIDLSERTLTFTKNGKVVLEAPVAIGTPENPTPTGRFYVNQRLRASDPSGPFGPAALGLSAYAPKLSDWPQGGPVAIHGTNDPGGIGQAISHGCIRVINEVLTRLYRSTPSGTPVVIHA